MSLDINVLRMLRHRSTYDRLIRAVPIRALDPTAAIIVKDFGAYLREHPEVESIETPAFMFWMKGWRHKDLKDEAAAVIGQLMKSAEEPIDPAIAAGMNRRLAAAALGYDLLKAIESFQSGEEIDLSTVVQSKVGDYEAAVSRPVKSAQILDPIEDLLKAEENDVGLHWRLACLNRHIKPLVGGDFVIVAGRPDRGKTTFLASELTFMAAQIDKLFPWTDEKERKSILWFNNEGPGKRIVTRNFQAALGATMEELIAKSNAGTLRSEYAAALGGRGGTLRVFDIHGMWNHEVEELIAAHNPALVVFDMVDNIRFGGETSNNGQRTDQVLEAMYQWARMVGVKHDCAVVATSQISADGDGNPWPTLPMLKDSKTGKQGAADVIITIGAVNDPALINSRYIGCTKNKKARTNMPGSPMAEVQFVGDRARYE